MHFYYRLSDQSYKKARLPGATKECCLDNAISIFGTDDFTIIADNISDSETFALLDKYNVSVLETNLGNAGSLLFTIDYAIQTQSAQDIAYFIEDDYLHKPHAIEMINEGFLVGKSMASYVSLYDHPDKYTALYNHGEQSKVLLGKLSHWRTTQSTCMTFATKIGTLKEDYGIWHKFTQNKHPEDHLIFSTIAKNLLIPIPGHAMHTDLMMELYSLSIGQRYETPSWVLRICCDFLIEQIKSYGDESVLQILALYESDLWKKLMLLDALIINLKIIR